MYSGEHPDQFHHSVVWNCTVQERKALQCVIKTAQYICGAALPSHQDIYNTRVTKRAHNITITLHTPSTHCSHCYHLAEATGAWKPEQPDLKTVFIHRPSGCWMTLSHDNSVYTTIQHNYICTVFNNVNHICIMYISSMSNAYIKYSYISLSFSTFCCMWTLHMLRCLLFIYFPLNMFYTFVFIFLYEGKLAN